MATIQKQQALTVLIDLLNRGVTESQIVQLINFATATSLLTPITFTSSVYATRFPDLDIPTSFGIDGKLLSYN